jgi:hypothetical protein
MHRVAEGVIIVSADLRPSFSADRAEPDLLPVAIDPDGPEQLPHRNSRHRDADQDAAENNRDRAKDIHPKLQRNAY